MMGVLLYFKQAAMPATATDHYSAGLVAQNYMGPIKKIPGDPHLVRIEVIVKDSPEQGGVQIQSVKFDGQAIPLKPRDIDGNRSKASFQMAPGKYTLRWVVQRDKTIWPRTFTHEEEVNVDPRDLWIQVTIQGEKASIQ